MLTVAYCRVSTEEQAAEGFSIDGQADKLIAYAELHDLGEVTVVEDAGASGKNLERPGLQLVLAMIDRVMCSICWCGDSIACRGTSEI
jgi:site-specific DNA recombinase